MASTSQAKVVGPTLPPGFTREPTPPSDDGEDVGPAPPPSGLEHQEDGVTRATREFLEREERQRQAREQAELEAQRAANSRPDWMLTLPTHTPLQKLVGDPTQLKSRGFSQTSARVQRKPTLPNGPSDSDMWTETPEQKAQRLRDEIDGKRARGEDKVDDQDDLRREMARRRDAAIEKSIEVSRGTSLLEQHKAKRREEVKHRSSRHDDDRKRHRSRSRSPDRRRHSSSRRDHDPDERKSERSSRHRDDDKERKPSRRHDSESEDEEERRRRRRKEKERKRKDEERNESKASAPVMWDRDAALSIGGKLMDENSRGKLLQDAAGLGSRFGSGSSRFL